MSDASEIGKTDVNLAAGKRLSWRRYPSEPRRRDRDVLGITWNIEEVRSVPVIEIETRIDASIETVFATSVTPWFRARLKGLITTIILSLTRARR